jgi:hypothetical protein
MDSPMMNSKKLSITIENQPTSFLIKTLLKLLKLKKKSLKALNTKNSKKYSFLENKHLRLKMERKHLIMKPSRNL